jgi:amidase
LPFGLQIVGPFRGDRGVLAVGAALERAFAGHADLARPLPDVTRLEKPVPALKSIVTHPPAAA